MYIGLNRERERAEQQRVDSRKARREVQRIELLLSPGQLLWRDENSGKYMLLTWKHMITGIAVESQWRKFKSKIR